SAVYVRGRTSFTGKEGHHAREQGGHGHHRGQGPAGREAVLRGDAGAEGHAAAGAGRAGVRGRADEGPRLRVAVRGDQQGDGRHLGGGGRRRAARRRPEGQG